MAVLLGIVDAPACQANLSWETNKIGGNPDWVCGDGVVPRCDGCGRTMHLACQLYCPLEGSLYHRTLYTFTCTHRPCWNTDHGWRVLRCQKLDKASVQPSVCPEASGDSSCNWGVEADDWGFDDDGNDEATAGNPNSAVTNTAGAQALPAMSRPPMDLVADIHGTPGLAASAFGSGDASANQQSPIAQGGMWRGGNSHLSSESYPPCSSSSHQGTVPLASQATSLERRPMSDMASSKELSPEDLGVAGSSETCPLPDLVQMTLHPDAEMAKDTGSDVSDSADVEAEPLPVSEERAEEMRRMLLARAEEQQRMESGGEAEAAVLTSFHLNVYEEESSWADAQDATMDHAMEALKKYEAEHGSVERTTADAAPKRGGGGGGGGEAYEKVGPHHGDLNHHKFLSSVQKYPGLCVRYQWQGKPLWISRPTTLSMPTRCRHCGGPCVFEFQLMPALINLLKVPGQSEPAVEFGTVLVFSCAGSCWQGEEEGVREENVFVQPDPDQHFFKV